jgi:tetratricopeptide (TPR) repeat protein
VRRGLWFALALSLAACGGGEKAQEQLAKGKALVAEGKHDAAEVELKKVTEADKNSTEAWLQLGHAYAGQKKYDEALSAYVNAKRADRHAIAPHVAHAKVQVALGRIDLATTELNFVVEMDPKNLEGLLLLGKVSQMPHKQKDGSVGVTKEDLERAELNLEAAAAIAPQNPEVKAELAKLREKLGKKSP